MLPAFPDVKALTLSESINREKVSVCVCVCTYCMQAMKSWAGPGMRLVFAIEEGFTVELLIRSTAKNLLVTFMNMLTEIRRLSLQLPDNQYKTWSTIYIVTCLWLERDRAYQTVWLACLCPGGGMMGTPPIKTINAQALHQSVSFTEDPPPPSGKPTSRFQGFCS